MPYKIVKTFEKGNSKLSAVPSNWEKDGILYWPRYNENKLRRVEDSCPENNWRKIGCKVKRSNLINFLKAEEELDKMCKKSDTDTDTEQYFNYVINQKDVTFDQIVQDCISDDNILSPGALERQENEEICHPVEARNLENTLLAIQTPAINSHVQQYVAQNLENAQLVVQPPAMVQPTATNADFNVQQSVTQPNEARNLKNAVLLVQPPATDTSSDAQQNETTEIRIDNATLTLMILEKINTLQKEYNTLREKVTENIKAQEEVITLMNQSVNSIALSLSKITVEFNRVMIGSENKKQNEANIQNIASESDLNNFEKELENPEAEEKWKKQFSVICGKGKGRGVNNAYALVDSMFSRSFLLQCSWAGGSRTSEQKICFKSHTKIIKFFFDIIHASDNSYTLLDCHQFFKNILKNSRQRNESKRERTSRTKNRPKIKAKRNLCNEQQPSLPIIGTSAPENRSELSLPVVGTSDSENRSEVSLPVVGTSGPENDDVSMSSSSLVRIPTESFETSV